MRCQFCGTEIPEADQFCGHCGARAPVAQPPSGGTATLAAPEPPGAAVPDATYVEAPGATQGGFGGGAASAPPQWTSRYPMGAEPAEPARSYGGFWLRLGAYILDTLFGSLIAIIPGIILAVLFYALVQAGHEDALTAFEQDEQDNELVLAAFLGFILGFGPVAFGYLYVSTALGGGWGKRICGLRIIKKDDGHRPGYGTAAIRVLVTIGFSVVGNIPLAGWAVWLLDYLWMLWDPEKQTLHDKAAGTLVVQT